jgi:hypothetical protein
VANNETVSADSRWGRKRGGNCHDEAVCPQAGVMEQVAWERRGLENRKKKFGMLRKICQKCAKIFQNSDRDKSHPRFAKIAKIPIDHKWREKARIPRQKIRHKSNGESKPLLNSEFKS